MRQIIALGLLGAGLSIGLPQQTAEAHGRYFYGGFGYGGGYGAYGGYGSYYGFGGHDVVPHWHDTYTPYGRYTWYGVGSHDYRPHYHTYSPWSYQGHHYSPWGYTRSYYPRYPYTYAPW